MRAPEFGPFDSLTDVAHGFYIDGFSARAVATCRTGRALAVAGGDVVSARYFRYIEAIALQELGRHAEAVRAGESLLAELGDEVEPMWRAKALALIAEASTRVGDARAIGDVAEAYWLLGAVPARTYGHLSASMAVGLALRSLNLLEEADAVLRSISGGGGPGVDVLVAQERALLAAYWGTSLILIGRADDAAARFVDSASTARRMIALAAADDDAAMVARGEVIEAFALMQLGTGDTVRLAAARARDAATRFTTRPELVETHLLRLVLARHAADEHRWAEAREGLENLVVDADEAGREVWAASARWALAQVHQEEVGPHPALEPLLTLARVALERVWSEREGRFAALHDRHQLRELTAETERISRVLMQDPLTRLGNRRLIDMTAERHADYPWAVFVDVDNFKAINDTFSHGVGDAVLRALGGIVRSQARETDLVARFGGDEFLVLLAGGGDAAGALAERVQHAVAAHAWGALADGLQVTVSIGVGPTDSARADRWAAADAALLEAKRAGRNRVVAVG